MEWDEDRLDVEIAGFSPQDTEKEFKPPGMPPARSSPVILHHPPRGILG